MWPDLLRQVQGMKRSTWMIVSANAQVHELAGGVLRLAFSNQGTARGFSNGQHAEVVAAAVEQLLGVAVRVEAVEGPAGGGPTRSGPAAQTRPSAPPERTRPPAQAPAAQVPAAEATPVRDEPVRDDVPPDPEAWEPPPGDPWATDAAPAAPARAARPTPPAAAPAEAPARPSRVEQMASAARPERVVDDVPSHDDPDLDDGGPAGTSVVEQVLGGSVIDVEQR